jgi:hypothetical protein
MREKELSERLIARAIEACNVPRPVDGVHRVVNRLHEA